MITKISPIHVAGEIFLLFWDRKWTYLAIGAAPVLLIVLQTFITISALELDSPPTSPETMGLQLLFTLLDLLVLLTTALVIQHFAVSQQRGNAQIVLKGLPGKIGKVLLFFLKLWLIYIVFTIPIIVAFILTNSLTNSAAASLRILIPSEGIMHLGLYIYTFTLYAGFIRLWIALPGIAMSELYKIRDIWQLTKGHGIRIVGLFLFLSLVLVGLMSLTFSFVSYSRIVCMTIACLLFLMGVVLASIMPAVWYVKLLPAYRERLKADGMAEISDDEVADAL